MKNILMVLALLSTIGCAAGTNGRTDASWVRSFDEAERLANAGKYREAHDAFLRLADVYSGSPKGEEALYRAARALVAFANPEKNYDLAGQELETLLKRYPSGKFAEDAADWRAALDVMQHVKLKELAEQAADYSKRITELEKEIAVAEARRNEALSGREALAAERDALKNNLESMGQERDTLARDASALLEEKNGLIKDKAALEKTVEELTAKLRKLVKEKTTLQQRLRDVTAVDINMEKNRKMAK